MFQPSSAAKTWSLHVNLLVSLTLCAFLHSTHIAAQSPATTAMPPASGPVRNTKVEAAERLFARDNLIAWCIVPFDSKKRAPEDRAAMLQKLGFKRFAYDWRAEHVPTFDAEVESLNRHGVALDAFWVAPGELNRESRIILDLLKRHAIKVQLWVLLDLGADKVQGSEQERASRQPPPTLRPLAERGRQDWLLAGGFYNHGGWFGEPENQIAIVERLKAKGVTNLGIVYNLHHGHAHIDRFPALLTKIMPYLMALNLNGTDPDGDKVGRKILPLGQGSRDLELLRVIAASGYRGPIGILGHTMDDAEERLKDNLDGLDWLVPQLQGHPPGSKPKPRTPVPPRPADKTTSAVAPSDATLVAALLDQARQHGDPLQGALVFASPKFACLSCHRVGDHGAMIGPDLSTVGICVKPEELVESVLWPRRQVKEPYVAYTVATNDGKMRQGYKVTETQHELVIRDPASGDRFNIKKSDVDEIHDDGTLMPDGLAAAMAPRERQDLIRFLLELGRSGSGAADLLRRQQHVAAEFRYDRAPLHPDQWPGWQLPVNRERVYDFYAKEAAHFMGLASVPALLPPYPGLDGGRLGHWGNQNEETWADSRWNQTDLGTVLSGVFRGAGVTVPKGVCLRLGDRGELATCFNPETLRYEALWNGGFVRFSSTRHGLLDGLILDGTPMARPQGERPAKPFVYHGFYRHGRRVVFSYRIGDVELLDAPWVENGQFTRVVAPANSHPLAALTRGGPAQWPQVITTKGSLGRAGAWPYVVDTIEPPFQNPWKAPLFFGDHDFFPDGTAMICTMQGDVWRVEGLDQTLNHVRWRRFASGLHQALGLVIAGGQVYVLGRDQISRLHDSNGDGEADFYECFSNTYLTSPAGHDFISGLQRDAVGRFYTASSKQGLLRIAADGRSVDIVATGFRNPDGLEASQARWDPHRSQLRGRMGAHLDDL